MWPGAALLRPSECGPGSKTSAYRNECVAREQRSASKRMGPPARVGGVFEFQSFSCFFFLTFPVTPAIHSMEKVSDEVFGRTETGYYYVFLFLN